MKEKFLRFYFELWVRDYLQIYLPEIVKRRNSLNYFYDKDSCVINHYWEAYKAGYLLKNSKSNNFKYLKLLQIVVKYKIQFAYDNLFK